MATEKQKQFCKDIYKAAMKINEISPVFIAAQACLESAWGARIIGKYNCFGITKGSNWSGKTILVLTNEIFTSPNVKFNSPEKVVKVLKRKDGRYQYSVYRLFKDFDSWEDCLREYLRIFKKPGYADAWPYRKNAKEFARRIVDCKGSKYATATNYYSIMCDMIDSVERIIK